MILCATTHGEDIAHQDQYLIVLYLTWINAHMLIIKTQDIWRSTMLCTIIFMSYRAQYGKPGKLSLKFDPEEIEELQ